MKASQLRDLTRKYAANGMSREEYLAERTRLIDGIVSGEIEIRYRELEPEPKRGHSTGSRARQWQHAAIRIFLVALLGSALVAYFIDTDSRSGNSSVSEKPVVNPGEALLGEFIRKGDWSEAALNELEAHWAAVSAFHREGARRSSGFRRLKNEISQRIREQEALVATGEPEALLQLARLRNLAAALGIENDH